MTLLKVTRLGTHGTAETFKDFFFSKLPAVIRVDLGGVSPRSSLSSSSAVVGLMTPSTSKPAKLLTSLWIRLSCGEGGGAGEGAACRVGQRVKKGGEGSKAR